MNYLLYSMRKRLLRFRSAPNRSIELPRLDFAQLQLPKHLAYPSLAYHDWTAGTFEQVVLRDGIANSLVGSSLNPHPLAPSLYLLRRFNQIGDGPTLSHVLRQVDALRAMADSQMHLYYKEVPAHWGVKAPMVSCISQGLALSVFVRAYILRPSEALKIEIEKLVSTLTSSIEEGGVVNNTSGGLVLEEYPGSQRYHGVLNGWLFGLIGLLEYAASSGLSGNPKIEEIYNSLVRHMPNFLRRYGHKYALGWSRLSGGEYPMIVCFQLAHISRLLSSKAWAKLSMEWSNFVFWPNSEIRFDAIGAHQRLKQMLYD